jgi:catechol 2,3-dioxygenase-like lactoylglutathione lyase family enzyme
MLSDIKLKAFIPTIQPDKARIFYQDILGLKLLSQDQFGLDFDAHGSLLRVAIVNELSPQPFTVLGFNLVDIIDMIKALNKKGVKFERYSYFEQDDFGIWVSPGGSRVAWFKDPDGNLLSLTEVVKSMT